MATLRFRQWQLRRNFCGVFHDVVDRYLGALVRVWSP